MLKYSMLAGAMMIAAPAVAQVAPAGQTSPSTGYSQTQTAPDQSIPAQAAPMDQVTPTQPSADTAAAQPTGDAVSQAVDQQFATYDKDGNGSLNKTEFSAWMVALKSQTDPATKPESAETKKWVGAAFAQADKNKNATLSKTELVGFLSQGQQG